MCESVGEDMEKCHLVIDLILSCQSGLRIPSRTFPLKLLQKSISARGLFLPHYISLRPIGPEAKIKLDFRDLRLEVARWS